MFQVLRCVFLTVYMLQMISIDSLTKVKVVTKEPGTAEGSSKLNEKGSTILLMTKEPGTAEGSSKLNVKGLTIVQSKKATVETHPTQKTITSSGKVTGARPPLKYIISKGQVRKYQHYTCISSTFFDL